MYLTKISRGIKIEWTRGFEPAKHWKCDQSHFCQWIYVQILKEDHSQLWRFQLTSWTLPMVSCTLEHIRCWCGQCPPWILCFFSVSAFALMCFVRFGWKMTCGCMKEISHWLWLFQNCLVGYCQPDIHELPGLLRKRWLQKTVWLLHFNRGCLVLSTTGLHASYAALYNKFSKRWQHWEFSAHLGTV